MSPFLLLLLLPTAVPSGRSVVVLSLFLVPGGRPGPAFAAGGGLAATAAAAAAAPASASSPALTRASAVLRGLNEPKKPPAGRFCGGSGGGGGARDAIGVGRTVEGACEGEAFCDEE